MSDQDTKVSDNKTQANLLAKYASKDSHIKSSTLSEDVKEQYYLLNKHRSKLFYVTFKLSEDESEIVVDKVGTKESQNYDDFLNSFDNNEIGWALISINYQTTDGGKRTKLIFITWVPDTLTRDSLKESARLKTQGVTQSGALKKHFQGINCKVQANDKDDLELANLIEKSSKNEREQVDENTIYELNYATNHNIST